MNIQNKDRKMISNVAVCVQLPIQIIGGNSEIH